jgi:hypothetical protein
VTQGWQLHRPIVAPVAERREGRKTVPSGFRGGGRAWVRRQPTGGKGAREPVRDDRPPRHDLGCVAVAVAVAVLGSGTLRWFDAALVGYLFGTLFAIFGVVYRFLVWLRRTRRGC